MMSSDVIGLLRYDGDSVSVSVKFMMSHGCHAEYVLCETSHETIIFISSFLENSGFVVKMYHYGLRVMMLL
jgi:hypothetical protein